MTPPTPTVLSSISSRRPGEPVAGSTFQAGRIEDYAIVGDLHTTALVGLSGSIDWLCLPRFDSAACFAALLGDERHGRWQLAPTGEVLETTRAYRDSSLVLDTTFRTATGTVRLTDAMPPRDGRVDLLRRLECLDGEVEMRMRWVVRFAYGAAKPWMRRTTDEEGTEAIVAIAGPDAVCLRGDVLPTGHGGVHEAIFTMAEGECVDSTMVWFSSVEPAPCVADVSEAIAATETWWREWIADCTYDGPHLEAVSRSLVVLKALTYAPTGGMVAAATTSLPEAVGGSRNWDYRFCWLRDATLVLLSFLESGMAQEAAHWRDWLLRAVAGDPADLQIAYGVGGERHLPELEIDWLPGYEGSSPVRVGNGAADQFQLDVYGEVLHAMEQARLAGIEEDDVSWPVQQAVLSYLEDNWDCDDRSLWEVRGPNRSYTHSKVMAWVAFDRGVKAVEEHGLSGDVERWRALRDEVREQVLEKGWNAEIGSFTQYYGSTEVDAALLVLPLVGFLPADDERMVSTVQRIRDELGVPFDDEDDDPVLLQRYLTSGAGGQSDGLEGEEGCFLACSFWLVENLAMSGRLEEAERCFERLLALRNDVGLLAEEYDVPTRRQTGNVPQAFSHLALVSAAQTLAHRGAPHQARQ